MVHFRAYVTVKETLNYKTRRHNCEIVIDSVGSKADKCIADYDGLVCN